MTERGRPVGPLAGQAALVTGASSGLGRATAVVQVVDTFGRIDVLVNAAGTDVPAPVAELAVQDFDRVLAVNLRAPFVLAKAVLPHMRAARGGTIVNVSSVAGKRGWANAAAYCASRFALAGLTQALAAEGHCWTAEPQPVEVLLHRTRRSPAIGCHLRSPGPGQPVAGAWPLRPPGVRCRCERRNDLGGNRQTSPTSPRNVAASTGGRPRAARPGWSWTGHRRLDPRLDLRDPLLQLVDSGHDLIALGRPSIHVGGTQPAGCTVI